MKKITLISLMVFWGFMVAVLTAGLVFLQNKTQIKEDETSKTAVLGESEKSDLASEVLVLSDLEVAKHKTASDCWMIVSNKVYDFTPYMNSHPGGSETITPYCGKDGTAVFNGKPHSAYATSLLQKYYLGDLNSEIKKANSKIATNTKNTTTSSPSDVKQVAYVPPVPVTTTTQPQQAQQGGSLTASDVASHNNSSDCWMIVSGKVYNVTSYIPSHPGGTGSIISYCGKDATSAFSGHSQNAANILGSYYVGDFGSNIQEQTTNPSPQSPVVSKTSSPQIPVQAISTSRKHDDDDDDD